MKKQYSLLINGLVLGGGMLLGALPAFALGENSSLSFQGNGSRVIDTNTPSASLPVSIMAEDLRNSSNSSSSVSYAGSNISASATTSDYGFSGSLSASGYNGAWRTGGYFHDELSFSSINEGNYTIDFVFDVHASAQLYSETGRSDLTMIMSYWDGHAYTSLDAQYLLSVNGIQQASEISGAYQISLSGIDYSNLIQTSDKIFLPYTIGLWGDAVDGNVSWNEVILTDVLVRDGSGAVLTQNSISLESNSLVFNSAASEVPLPGAIWLFGFGFAGLAGLRKRA